MPTTPEQLDLEGSRVLADALLDGGDVEGAEALLRTAVARWPDRLGLQLKLARSIERQDRWADARQVVEQAIRGRSDLPPWSRSTVAHFGYVITSGVLLDIEHEAIAGFMKSMFVAGEYETIEAELLREVLRPDDVVLEVGGGIGFMGTHAKLIEPSVTFVSYEANPALMPIIARTKQLNGVDFEVHNAMLGARDGSADFFVNKAFWASSATHDYGGAEVIQVPVRSVADAMSDHRFNVVVMDIEGGEIDLVPSMELSTVDRFVLETHPQITGARAVAKLLRRLRSDFGFTSAREAHGVHLLVRTT